MSDDTPIDDDSTDSEAETDEQTESITLEFAVELDDDLHREAWRHILATAPDRETAARTIASRTEFSVGPKEAIYQQYRLIDQQREQIEAQRAQQAQTQAQAHPEIEVGNRHEPESEDESEAD